MHAAHLARGTEAARRCAPASDYAALRAEQKPHAEQQSVDDEMRQQKEKRAADLAELKKNIAALPPEYRKAAEDAFQKAAEGMKGMETPEALETERKMIEAKLKDQKAELDDAMQTWSEQYPAKPSNWKLAFRAGRETTEKARAFAKRWLAELK